MNGCLLAFLIVLGLGVLFGIIDGVRQQVDPKYRAQVQAERAAREKKRKDADVAEEKAEQAKRAAQAKQEKLLAEQTAVYGPKPDVSGWDGLAEPAHAYLQKVLNDPDSLKVAEVTDLLVDKKRKCWAQYGVIRAKNGFGAVTRKEVIFYIKNDAVIDTEGM